jgi:preprotein translocase subunit SecD
LQTPTTAPTEQPADQPDSNNRPPVGFDRAADPTGEPTNEPTRDPTPTDDASPSEPAGTETPDDVPGVDDEQFVAPVEDELAWSQSPDPAIVSVFDQYACAQDGTLTMADGSPATVAPDAPVTIPSVDDPSKPLVACSQPEDNPGEDEDVPAGKYLLSRAVIQGTDLDSASAGVPQNQVSWVVNLEVGGAGKDAFTAISRALVGTERQFAIVLDGSVISSPTMEGVITNGQAEISGNFNETTATSLATSLKYGALPLSFDDRSTTVEEIGPTLAGNQLAAGITAGLIGLGLVMLYCLIYYRGLGLVVLASLGIAAVVTYALVLLLGEAANFTLTLPGIAGLIVAVGITADSFIVYFERIRDEMREGKSMRVAVESGWVRARNTCLAADAVSVLAAIALFIFAVGVVKGFAFALGLSTLIDVVVFFFFTKPMVSWLARFRFFNRGHKLSGLDPSALGVEPVSVGAVGGRA